MFIVQVTQSVVFCHNSSRWPMHSVWQYRNGVLSETSSRIHNGEKYAGEVQKGLAVVRKSKWEHSLEIEMYPFSVPYAILIRVSSKAQNELEEVPLHYIIHFAYV